MNPNIYDSENIRANKICYRLYLDHYNIVPLQYYYLHLHKLSLMDFLDLMMVEYNLVM